MFEHIFSKKVSELIMETLPIIKVNSFDCARRSMGVCVIEVCPFMILPRIILHGTIDQQLSILERHIALLSSAIDNIIKIKKIDVWDLGANISMPWEVALPLKTQLDKLSQPDYLVYEFQMDLNDKSRMISTMIAYHYAGVKTIRTAPAVKNTLCIQKNIDKKTFCNLCPVVSAKRVKMGGSLKPIADVIFTTPDRRVSLNIQEFLKCYTVQYSANKMHTAAMLEWWASIFKTDIQHIPKTCLDDAGDAFIQVLGALKRGLF
jgi:hypothetical protein